MTAWPRPAYPLGLVLLPPGQDQEVLRLGLDPVYWRIFSRNRGSGSVLRKYSSQPARFASSGVAIPAVYTITLISGEYLLARIRRQSCSTSMPGIWIYATS